MTYKAYEEVGGKKGIRRAEEAVGIGFADTDENVGVYEQVYKNEANVGDKTTLLTGYNQFVIFFIFTALSAIAGYYTGKARKNDVYETLEDGEKVELSSY